MGLVAVSGELIRARVLCVPVERHTRRRPGRARSCRALELSNAAPARSNAALARAQPWTTVTTFIRPRALASVEQSPPPGRLPPVAYVRSCTVYYLDQSYKLLVTPRRGRGSGVKSHRSTNRMTRLSAPDVVGWSCANMISVFVPPLFFPSDGAAPLRALEEDAVTDPASSQPRQAQDHLRPCKPYALTPNNPKPTAPTQAPDP